MAHPALGRFFLALGLSSIGAQVQAQYVTLSSPGSSSITDIYLGNDLSGQIQLAGSSYYAIYSSTAIPANYQTFLVVDGVGYRPTNNSGGGVPLTFTPFTNVSQSTVDGDGSTASPYTVTTTVAAGTTGLSLAQTVTFVAGNPYFNTRTVITNGGATAQNVILYRGWDCYLGDSDSGFGMQAPNFVACTQGLSADNTPIPGTLVEGLYAVTPTSNMFVGAFNVAWNYADAMAPVPGGCDSPSICTSNANAIDNGLIASWSLTVPAGGSVTVNDIEVLPPDGILPAVVNPSPPDCTASPNPAKPTDTVTITCTGGTAGNTLTIPGSSCTPAASVTFGSTGAATCAGTGASLGNDPPLRVTDGAGNTSDGNVPLRIARTAAPMPVPALRDDLLALLGMLLVALGLAAARGKARRT